MIIIPFGRVYLGSLLSQNDLSRIRASSKCLIIVPLKVGMFTFLVQALFTNCFDKKLILELKPEMDYINPKTPDY